MKIAWPSEKRGNSPKQPFWVRRKLLDPDMIWGKTRQGCLRAYEFHENPRPVQGRIIELMSEVDAKHIRDLATPEAFWLDPNQQPIRVELPSDTQTEYRVEAYHWPGIKEKDKQGRPTGYMIEQEKYIQILVAREIKNEKVIREWEEDFEEVPLWHFIDRGCLGDSRWRSKFAQHI